jgi:RNase adapter protein RapZ
MQADAPISPNLTPQNPSLLVVSGISGSGKSIALTTLEDQGFYCVDNLPAGLIGAFVKQTLLAQTQASTEAHLRIAVGIDARNRPSDLQQIPHVLAELAQTHVEARLVFLDASTEVLLKRYSETRRRHPLSKDGVSLQEAIARERALMHPIASLADIVIDTSESNVHQLRRRVMSELGLSTSGLSVLFESFAYKKGLPADADFVFDARALPNPHWDARLRPLSGRDEAVRDWLASQAEVMSYLSDLKQLLQRWLPASDTTERNYVTVAIGCTGGRHRSVFLVEQLAQFFAQTRPAIMRFHRELG